MKRFWKEAYGPLGVLVIAVMEYAAVFHIREADRWVTAFGWYGYIFFLDWLVYRKTSRSLIMTETKKFFVMLPFSVALWSLFELHNLAFHNWEYTGIPRSHLEAIAGFVVSFSTVLPGIYETFDLLKSYLKVGFSIRPQRYSRARIFAEIIFGLVLVAITIIYPSNYTGVLVWPGYFFVFSPLNYLLGAPSVLREREKGRISETFYLVLAGYMCGLFWEFLNFWAGAKWVYHVPYFSNIKYFEMPLAGFLGFGPFALAFIEMYRFVLFLPQLAQEGSIRRFMLALADE